MSPPQVAYANTLPTWRLVQVANLAMSNAGHFLPNHCADPPTCTWCYLAALLRLPHLTCFVLFNCRNASSLDLVADSAGRLRLLCFPLHAYISVKHVVTLDPSYYSFEYCDCEEGLVAIREHNSEDRVVSMFCEEPEVRLDLAKKLDDCILGISVSSVEGLYMFA